MEKVIYNLVFNRKKRLNAEGKALIQVEAYLNRQKKYFSTKIYVKPTQWDSKRKAVRNHPNMDELNQYIEDYITYLERIELDMVQSGRPFSLKYLRERGDFESVSSSFVMESSGSGRASSGAGTRAGSSSAGAASATV